MTQDYPDFKPGDMVQRDKDEVTKFIRFDPCGLLTNGKCSAFDAPCPGQIVVEQGYSGCHHCDDGWWYKLIKRADNKITSKLQLYSRRKPIKLNLKED